jgi:ABC-type transport system substrate-binding protein
LFTEYDPEKRLEIIHEIQKLGVDNAVYVYLYQVSHPIAMRNNVQDVWYHPGSTWVVSPVHKTK